MKEIFLKIAERNGEPEIAGIEKAINEAALGQRSIIEELLNRDIFNEEDFLQGLAEELNISWEENLKTINKRKLREVCSAQLALKHRLLPLSFGDGSELIEEEEVWNTGRIDIDACNPHGSSRRRRQCVESRGTRGTQQGRPGCRASRVSALCLSLTLSLPPSSLTTLGTPAHPRTMPATFDRSKPCTIFSLVDTKRSPPSRRPSPTPCSASE